MARKASSEQKKAHPNTNISTLSKDCTWMDNLSKESLRFFPGKEEWRQRLIHTLWQFVDEHTDMLMVEEFLFEYKIPRRSMDWMRENYEDVRQAIDDVKIFLAMRRKKGCMTNKLNMAACFKDMHVYDPEWSAVDQYHAALRNKDEDKPTQIVVNMADYAKEQK